MWHQGEQIKPFCLLCKCLCFYLINKQINKILKLFNQDNKEAYGSNFPKKEKEISGLMFFSFNGRSIFFLFIDSILFNSPPSVGLLQQTGFTSNHPLFFLRYLIEVKRHWSLATCISVKDNPRSHSLWISQSQFAFRPFQSGESTRPGRGNGRSASKMGEGRVRYIRLHSHLHRPLQRPDLLQ